MTASLDSMAALVDRHDWSASGLGAAETWSPVLRGTVDLVLAHGFPMVLLWGPDLVQLYNDGYRAMLGEKHPAALAQPTRLCWPEAWHINAPIYARVQDGETLTFADKHIPLVHGGPIENARFTLTYSPVREGGRVAGILVTVFETTRAHVEGSKRAAAEQAARDAERRAPTLVEAIREADSDGAVIGDSPSWRADTGQSAAQWQGFGWLDAVHPDDRAHAEAQWHAALLAPSPADAEFRVRHGASGGYRWINVRAVPMTDADGSVRKWFGMNIDIDARRRAEDALRQREADLARVQRIGGVGGIDVDLRAGAQSNRSPEYLGLHGLPLDTQAESHADWRARVHPEDVDAAERTLFAALQGNEDSYESEYRILRPSDGALRWILARGDIERDAEGRAVRLVGAHLDITEQKENQERTRRSEERKAILLRLSDALCPLADPAQIQRAATRILGEALGAAWCYYAEYSDGPARMLVRSDYNRDGGPSLAGTYTIKSFDILEALRAGRTVAVADTHNSPLFSEESRAEWQRIGLRSAVGVPIVKRGVLIAALTVADTVPRDWDGHVELIEAFAERTWSAAERASSEEALRESERRLRTLVAGVPQLVWRATDAGQWTWASAQWADYTGQPEPESHGVGWLDAVHPDDRAGINAAWSSAIERGVFKAEYRIRHAAEDRYRWFQTRATPVRDEAGLIAEWLGTSTDVDEMRGLQERQQILLAELQHRVRNILAVVRSVFARTMEADGAMEEIADHFRGRLDSLARTQVAVTQSATGFVDLENLIRDELLSVGASDGPDLTIDGPEVGLGPRAAESIGLAIHELTTNALKFGALKVKGAQLKIGWTADVNPEGTRRLSLTWHEQGVPAVSLKPARYGFGSELIEEALPYRLGAETKLEFRGGGVRCAIDVPLVQERIAAAAE